MVGQPCRHRRCTGPPASWPSPSRWSAGAAATAGVSWHAASKSCDTSDTRPLLAYALLVFAERDDAPPDGRHMLADRQVARSMKAVLICQPVAASTWLTPARVPNTTRWRTRTSASAAILFDHLRIEQLGQRHPAGFGRGACGLAAWRLYPLPIVRQQRGHILLEPIGEEQGHTAWRQHLGHLMDHALRHGQGALADVDRQQQLGDRVDGRPTPSEASATGAGSPRPR